MKKLDSFLVAAISWCFQVVLLVTPLLFTWFNEESFEFNKMLFVYAMSSIIGGLWITRLVLRRKFIWGKTIFDLPIGLFILSQLLSTLFSLHPQTSVFGYYTRFHGGLLSTFAYVTLFAVFSQTIQPKQIWIYFQTLAVGSLVVSLIAIPEHFGHSLSCVFINSSYLAEDYPLSKVLSLHQLWTSYNVKCWIQDAQNRVFATFGQPNWLAAYAITLLPVFAVLTSIRKKSEPWLYAVASLGLFMDLLFSKSRSGILGWAVGVVWLIGLLIVWEYQHRSHNRQSFSPLQLKNTAFVGIGLVVLAAVFGTPYTPSVKQLLHKKESPQVNQPTPQQPINRLELGGTDSGEIRKIVWQGAIDIWKKYPLFGSGVETFAYSYNFTRPMAHNNVSEWKFIYNKAHNEFLNFLATTGAIGLISYCLVVGMFIGVPVVFAFRNKELSSHISVFFFSISTGLVGLTVSNALGFSTVTVAVLLFLYPAIIWVLNQQTLTPAKPSLQSEKTLTLRDKLWTGVIGLIVLVILVFIWRMWRADYLFARGKLLNQRREYVKGIAALEESYRITGQDIFAEQLAQVYSSLSIAFTEMNQATSAAFYRLSAEQKAEEVILDNPYNVNFYKTKTRVLVTLSLQDPKLLKEAEDTLNTAAQLAPTDPEVRYNLGLIKLAQNQFNKAQADFEQTIEMKPNYEEARVSLAKLYTSQKEWQKAKNQYVYILEHIQPANTVAQAEIKQLDTMIATASATPKLVRPLKKP